MENKHNNTSCGTNPTSNGVKVLAIGSDRSIVNPKSASAERQIAYGQHFDALDIIVFSRGAYEQANVTLSAGVHVYPTQSRSRLLYGLDAMRIAWHLPKPDVVTVQDPFESGLVGWLIARLRGAKFHVQVHTDFLSPHFDGAVNRIRRILARFVLARADRIRVVSNRIKESLLSTNHYQLSTISVLPVFVDIARFRGAHAGILAGRFARFATRLLIVARLEREKNVTLALESFAKAAPPDACLIIVGDGRERRALEKRASPPGVASRVFFEGNTNPLPYYAVADLLLVPSRYEGYGLVIIEALAAGKPVLSTDVGIAREAGAIVTDAAHFAESLKAWLENGPREGQLQHYPYRSFEEYVQIYCNDVISTAATVYIH